MAHLAGEEDDEPEMFVNVAGEEESEDAGEEESEESDDGVYRALAVAGLDSLNLWAA
jgi:hypothetical protein